MTMPLNPYGTVGEPAYSTTNPPPTTAPVAAAPVPTGTVDAIEQRYGPAVSTAQEQYNRANQQLRSAQDAFNALPADDPINRASAQNAVRDAERNVQEAANTYVNAQKARADAYEKGRYSTNEEKQLALARADDAQAQATLRRTQAAEAIETRPSEIARVQAQAQEATASAALSTAKLNLFTATEPQQRQQAQLSVDQAAANLQTTQNANKKAGFDLVTAEAQAQVAGRVAQAGAKAAESTAAAAAATAAVSPQLAQTSVDQAQANVNKTLTDIAELQRQLRQAPTDEQAQQAIQTQLASKQTELQTAQQQLEQAKRLMPIAVESAGLGVEQQRATLQRQAQGPLYGVVDQIAKYKELIASGQMSPEAADAAISDYVNQQVTGSTALQRQTAQNQYQQSQYQTQTDFNRSMAQTGAGFMNQGLGTLTNALGTMTPGHGAEYAGAVQALAGLWNQIGQKYAAPAPPASAVQTAPVVHINIGNGQPTDQGAAPVIPGPLNAGAPAQPVAAGAAGPVLPDHMRPATPQDVMSLWGSGGIDRTSQGLGGI